VRRTLGSNERHNVLGDVQAVTNEIEKLQAEVELLKALVEGPPPTLDIADSPIIQRLDYLERRVELLEREHSILPFI
jgi:hypothetical protein